jgi:aromatic-L-amino-acid decarboxylase
MEPNEFRDTGHRLIDQIASYLEGVEERSVLPAVSPAALTELFDEPLPQEGSSAETVVAELEEKLLPYCTHVNHPGYFGLITPSPTPMGVLGDLLASALNQNVGAWQIGPSATAMERRTVRWLTDLVGWDARAGGNLTSGGTMANFIGLKLARDFASGDRAQHEGVSGRWAAYASEERHVSVDKAVDAVGIGRQGLRVLPTDEHFRVRIDALEQAIARDKAAGVRPMCIVAIAGATNTGSVDDFRALRRIADRERAWLHADCAYGGGLLLSEEHKAVLSGLELCDSVVLDPHKWFYAPLDCGAILVRDEARLTASFGLQPSYLTDEMDAEGERYLYYVHGFEQSRRFRSLKVWMSFKRYGAREIGRWVERNVAQAQRLWRLVQERADFEAALRPPMSAICVRSTLCDPDEDRSVRLHRTVARRIQEGGRFWISTNVAKGHHWFRINPVNFRTRDEHMDELLDLLAEECAQETATQPRV